MRIPSKIRTARLERQIEENPRPAGPSGEEFGMRTAMRVALF
jgi:hypothetical protein